MKTRKTLTNLKRVDRLKATAIFCVLQIILIGLVVFIFWDNAPVYSEQCEFIEGRAEDYRFRRAYGFDRHFITINETEYEIYGNKNIKSRDLRQLLKTRPDATLLVNNKKVISYSLNGVEYLSVENYNTGLRNNSIWVTVFLFIIDILIISYYVAYMIYHRTSKDPIFRIKPNKKEENHG